MSNRIYYVYTLSSSSDDTPMYIGVTINPKQRLSGHISQRNAYDTAKCLWIRGLVGKGERPVMNIIAKHEDSRSAARLESEMIEKVKRTNPDLTNKILGSSGIRHNGWLKPSERKRLQR